MSESDFKFPVLDAGDVVEVEDAPRRLRGLGWSTWSRSCCPQTAPSTARGPREWRSAVLDITFFMFITFTKISAETTCKISTE